MSLCILTNATALFPPTSSTSVRLIRNMPVGLSEKGVLLPEIELFQHIFNELEREFRAILVLTSSQALHPTAQIAQIAAQGHGGTAKITIVDSLQIGPGVGILAQLAARRAANGASLPELEEYIRSVIPYIFTLLYPEKIPLFQNADKEQTLKLNSEQTNPTTLFLLDEGLLTPYKKVRTQRHLLENLHEFLEEFDQPQHVSYFHGKNANLHTRPLLEISSSLFPSAHFNDLDLNQELSALLGEHTVGLTVMEIPGMG